MTPIQNVLKRLAFARRCVNNWMVHCPAHQDDRESLSVSECDDGVVLMYCFAGCSIHEICKKIGIKVSDLWPDGSKRSSGIFNKAEKKIMPTITKPKDDRVFDVADYAIAELNKKRGAFSRLWAYEDVYGNHVGYVIRWDLPNGKKDLRPVSLIGDKWVIGGMQVPRPLFRLPSLIPAKTVYICEGEKAAESLCKIGLIATTSSNGAGAAEKTDWTPLAGKDIIILPDNDEPGLKYARKVEQILSGLKPRPHVRVILLPGLPPRGDAADFIGTLNR